MNTIRTGAVALAAAVLAATVGAAPAQALRLEPRDHWTVCTTATYLAPVSNAGVYHWYVVHSDGSRWLHRSKDLARQNLLNKNVRRGCNITPLPSRLPGDPAVR